jgi:DinB superfamily
MGSPSDSGVCVGGEGTRPHLVQGAGGNERGAGMTIRPDTKDWTWVLERACPECGFDTRTVTRRGLPGMLKENAATWQRVLSDKGEAASARPSPDRWSTLEYACHVRDVFRRFDERLQLMLSTEGPTFAHWDQDATAVDDRYNEQSPREVATQLVAAAASTADRFSVVTDSQWERDGTRSDGAHFTVETLGRYLMHDPVHHLHDVGAGGIAGRCD